MTDQMTVKELWCALVCSALSFTGLWRITTQIRVALRSDAGDPRLPALLGIYYPAWTCRLAGAGLAVAFGLSLAGVFAMPRLMWVPVATAFALALALAGRGRTLLGAHTPEWMLDRTTSDYEGYGESLRRLPETTIDGAKACFSSGQEAEGRGDTETALACYAQALEHDPTFVRCLTAKGILHCMQRELDIGRELFERAAQAAPWSAWALHLLARVESQLGLLKQANEHHQIARRNLDNERAKEMLRRMPGCSAPE